MIDEKVRGGLRNRADDDWCPDTKERRPPLQLKPYLIEVNHLPSFGTDSPLDEDIKSRVVEQTLSILRVNKGDKRVFNEKKKKEVINCEERSDDTSVSV